MKLYRNLIVPIILSIFIMGGIFCLGQNSAQLILTIQGQGLIIGTPANISLGDLIAGTTEEFTFSDYLWIEDLRGSKNGHYTSIQGLVYGGDGEIISGATVEFSTNSGEFTLIGGVIEDETFDHDLINYTDITEPKILFYRNNDENHIGYVNRLGFKPKIRVTLPSGSTGPYTLRLSYTLYDMPVTIQ